MNNPHQKAVGDNWDILCEVVKAVAEKYKDLQLGCHVAQQVFHQKDAADYWDILAQVYSYADEFKRAHPIFYKVLCREGGWTITDHYDGSGNAEFSDRSALQSHIETTIDGMVVVARERCKTINATIEEIDRIGGMEQIVGEQVKVELAPDADDPTKVSVHVVGIGLTLEQVKQILDAS